MKLFCILLLLSILPYTNSFSQEPDLSEIPLISEYPEGFDFKSDEYKTTLIEAVSYDMNEAYSLYMNMIKKMNACAIDMGYDLNGVQMWVKFFFDKDGTIDYISYFLKPKSKQVSTKILNEIFSKLKTEHKLHTQAESKYLHFGNASFPVRK